MYNLLGLLELNYAGSLTTKANFRQHLLTRTTISRTPLQTNA